MVGILNIIYSHPLDNFIYNFCDPKHKFSEDQIPYIQEDFSVSTRDRLFNVLQRVRENEPPSLRRVWHLVQSAVEYAIRLLEHYFGLEKEKTIDPELTRKFVKFMGKQKLALKTVFEGAQGEKRYKVFEKNFAMIQQKAPYKFDEKDQKTFGYIRPEVDNYLSEIENKISYYRQELLRLQAERKQAENNPLFDLSAKYRAVLARYCESSPPSAIEPMRQEDEELLSSLKHIVISGGGAKGSVLPSAFRTLLKRIPVSMGQVENLIGSSVGAFTAALIATGASREGLKDIAAVNFNVLLGRTPVYKNGDNLKLFIRESIRINILERLSEMSQEMRSTFDSKYPEMRDAILENLKCPLEKSIITFAMLSYLREIDPKSFKNLIITATTDKQQLVLSEENTPNNDIAEDCRASISIPGVFQPVKRESENGLLHLYDGGIADNTPVALIPDPTKSKYTETLVVVFEEEVEEGELSIFDPKNERPIYSPTCLDRFLRDVLPFWLFGFNLEKPNTESTLEILQNVKQNFKYVLSFPVDLKLTDFGRASRNFRKYVALGKRVTNAFLEKCKKAQS